MTATEILAIIGALTTPTVALAGYAFHEVSARRDREAARGVAADAHVHELAVRRSDRAYEDRKATYRLLLDWALTVAQQVELVEPIARWSGQPGPPPSSPEDEFRRMHIEATAFASRAVHEALDAFRADAQRFFMEVGIRHQIFAQVGAGTQVSETSARVEDARAASIRSHRALEELIKDELATL